MADKPFKVKVYASYRDSDGLLNFAEVVIDLVEDWNAPEIIANNYRKQIKEGRLTKEREDEFREEILEMIGFGMSISLVEN
jgi:hypothetical protein